MQIGCLDIFLDQVDISGNEQFNSLTSLRMYMGDFCIEPNVCISIIMRSEDV